MIRLLPDSVANQIAAGEVIQRPASVVKELVENAIDAGASSVQIVVKDAGRTLIQVIDNGCGMSTTDARMAFERHATSKISRATDLYSLHTMGFRGEALPSIAAVAEIEMRTMRRDDVAGTRIVISASQVEKQEPDVCSSGTNIMVKRLFFNLPARRKFLKKDPVEMGHIMREFERLALVNTGVEFSITHNDVLLHKLQPAPLKKRIADLFGGALEHQLLPMGTETSLVKIDGFVSLPQHARKRGALQYFFVNGRNMRHPYFHKAVLACYDKLISPDVQPNYFINFTVDPQTIDVNIHPQKHEIKFENEQPVWQILTAAVRETLGRFNVSSALDFEAVDVPDIPAFNPAEAPELPSVDTDLDFNPFNAESPGGGASHTRYQSAAFNSAARATSIPSDWDKLYAGFKNTPVNAPVPEAPPTLMPDETAPVVQAVMQLKNRYILTPAKSGLMIIDQHRAHTLILYRDYLDMMQKGDVPSQRLIFPETVTLDPSSNVIATSAVNLLNTMGFDVSNLGGTTWAINAVPAVLGKASITDTFMRILSALAEETEDVAASRWQRIALSMAYAAAVKYGTPLTAEEMDHLISTLLRLPEPNFTPDGKTVLTVLDLPSITSRF